MREILRRIVYYVSGFVATLLAFYFDFTPFVIVKTFDPYGEYRNKNMRLNLERNTITVDTKEWLEIYEYLTILDKKVKNFENRDSVSIPDEYRKRLGEDTSYINKFFFKINEPPINQISHLFKTDNQILYIRIFGIEKYLKINQRIFKNEDFGFGGLRAPEPPTWMIYPYRKYSFWIFLLGAAIYFLMPLKKLSDNAISYPRWRVILTDLTATILILMFFALPIAIIGSTQVAISTYPWFCAMFWWAVVLGLFVVKIAIWQGSYQIVISEDGIKIADYRRIRQIKYDDIENLQPAIIKPPKWLIKLSWLTAFLSKKPADLGRAILMSTSEAKAIVIKLKDGREIFIIVSDHMGWNALKGFNLLIDTLIRKGVRELDNVRELRTLGMEAMK